MKKVVADGKGVVGFIGLAGVVGREIKHHIQRFGGVRCAKTLRHTHNLRVAGNHTWNLMGKDRIALIMLTVTQGKACPRAHVIGHGYADALSLKLIHRIDSSGIIEHDEAMTKGLPVILVDGALVLG